MSKYFNNLTVKEKITTNILNTNEAILSYEITDNISSNYSEIDNLLTINAQFQNLIGDNVTVTNLLVNNLNINNLTITNLTITDTTNANTIINTNLTYTTGINDIIYLPNQNNVVNLGFTNSLNTGIYKTDDNNLVLASNGTSNGTISIQNTSITVNKNILNIDGTESLPSYSFENRTDTGFFRPDNNQFAFTVNGDEKMRVKNDGIIMDNIGPATRINAVNGNNRTPSYSFSNFSNVGIFRGTNLGEIGLTTNLSQTNVYFNNLSTTIYDPVFRELDNTNISSTLNGGYALSKDVKYIVNPYLASNTISNWNYAEYLENINVSLTCVAYSGLLNLFTTLGNNGVGVYSNDGGITWRNTTMSGQLQKST